jgi:hypothetical protein
MRADEHPIAPLSFAAFTTSFSKFSRMNLRSVSSAER